MRERFTRRLIRLISVSSILCILALVLMAAVALCQPIHDIDRIVMGRTTYPKRATSMQVLGTYLAPTGGDPSNDSFAASFSVSRGVTDRLTLGSVLIAKGERRDRLDADRVGAVLSLRLVDQPFELTSNFRLLPSVRGEPVEFKANVVGLRNTGPWSLALAAALESEQEKGEEREQEYEIEPAAFYRFGIHGLMGVEAELDPEGGHHRLDLVLGGSVSKHLFLAFEPKFALVPNAGDFEMNVQLQFYRGPYSLGSWQAPLGG